MAPSFATLALFLPHGQCYLWDPGLVWLHAGSDAGIALAYYSIPFTLAWFVRRRRDLPFPRVFLLFALFIVACGTNHALSIWNIWHADYWAEGAAKAVTAAASLVTALALVRVIPPALRLRSVSELERINQNLEARVDERTRALAETNEFLRAEIRVRRSAEAAVRDLNERLTARLQELEALFRVLPVGVGIATDPACRQIQVNPAFARLLGIDPGDNASLSAPQGEGPTNFEVWHEDRRLSPAELPMQTAARENRQVHNFEERIVRRDGTAMHLIADAVPLRHADGSVRGAVGTFRDVSILKQVAEERMAIERRLLETRKLESVGILAAGVAHDFNNMLAIINGNAELAAVELRAGADVSAHLGAISETVERAADLCRQLLAYAGQGRFELQRHDLNALVRETTSLRQGGRLSRHRVSLDLAPDLPPVEGDGTQLRQLLLNVLTNAAEAAPASGGHLRISTAATTADAALVAATLPAGSLPPGPCVHVQIADNGEGIDAATLERIFLPFFTTKFTGRGLGLAAVLGIIRSHHGGVRVHSVPGTGTTFDIFLPPAAPAAAPGPSPVRVAGHPDVAAPLPQLRLQGRVLVVDDEAALRSQVARALQNCGLEVVEAADGVVALELLERDGAFHLVLLDVTMPRLDGHETLRKLREHRPQLPVVVMSGYASTEIGVQFAPLRPAAVLPKPFPIRTLLDVVREHVSPPPA